MATLVPFKLYHNDRPITSHLTLSWKCLPRLPVTDSAAVDIIGGMQERSLVNSIHQLVDGENWLYG